MTLRNGDDAPLVSVIMPVLDPDPAYFRESIASIAGQTLDRLEIIVVEDPSPRSAREIVDSLADPRIRYVRNPERTSLVRQRNQGIALARADLVAFQDADDVAERDRLAKQHAFMAAHPRTGVLGAQLRVIDAGGDPLGYRRYPEDHASIVRAMRLYNPIAHPAVMFRKAAVVAGGAYQYDAHPAEDYELWSRLAHRQVQFANHPEALLRYRIHVEASKASKLHATIRGTLAIKKMYWRESMDAAARARMAAEYLLLAVPAKIVLGLFLRTQLARSLR